MKISFNNNYREFSFIAILQRWSDEFLVWNPLEYEGLKSIDISSTQIWKPDFALYNA